MMKIYCRPDPGAQTRGRVIPGRTLAVIRRLLGLLLCLHLALPGGLAADEYVQYTGQGQINWYSGEMSALSDPFFEGPPARASRSEAVKERRARIQARKRLWETLRRVRIDRRLAVSDVLEGDSELAETILGEVHNSRLQTVEDPDGGKRVRAALQLRGNLAGRLIPRSVWFEELLPGDVEATREPEQDPESGTVRESSGAYTGLVVDMRGLDFDPALLLRIHDQQGRELYGPTLVDPLLAIREGLCLYTTELHAAVSADRVGENPFLVRINRLEPGESSGIRFSPQTTEDFLAGAQLETIYQQCRVVIVLKDGAQRQ